MIIFIIMTLSVIFYTIIYFIYLILCIFIINFFFFLVLRFGNVLITLYSSTCTTVLVIILELKHMTCVSK